MAAIQQPKTNTEREGETQHNIKGVRVRVQRKPRRVGVEELSSIFLIQIACFQPSLNSAAVFHK
ncbi:hypothetical protein HYC85_023097 [Camellia sinensis]|uniref:Uncharacterized protein n=1 Tax=Camellia sinensis TaxID=4442 RepID=A0A7J7GHE1_CAMSI|nr:hypothetical protein HYC85_023097 [Camellia sinensis]